MGRRNISEREESAQLVEIQREETLRVSVYTAAVLSQMT